MAINFPASLDNFANPQANDPQNNPSHSSQHANANDAIEAIETKIGIGASTPTAGTFLGGTGDGTSSWQAVTVPTKATKAENVAGTEDTKFTTPLSMAEIFKPTEGTMYNGRIAPSVASNNLTVALKTLAGTDPSASNPVYIMIGGVMRTITSALSVTKNAGTNWCNAGSAELATKEVDYFVYLGYNATDGVVIGFSRIPYGALYSEFSATTTNEKYCAISTITNATASDVYTNIGRFAATLSAGAGYTWTVPTFTAINLIQRPIDETRWLNFFPTLAAVTTAPTLGSGSVSFGNYKILGRMCDIQASITFGSSGVNAGNGSYRPMLPIGCATATGKRFYGSGMFYDSSAAAGYRIIPRTIAGVTDRFNDIIIADSTNYTLGNANPVVVAATDEIGFNCLYEII